MSLPFWRPGCGNPPRDGIRRSTLVFINFYGFTRRTHVVTSVVVRANPRKQASDAIEVESDATHHTGVIAGPVTHLIRELGGRPTFRTAGSRFALFPVPALIYDFTVTPPPDTENAPSPSIRASSDHACSAGLMRSSLFIIPIIVSS